MSDATPPPSHARREVLIGVAAAAAGAALARIDPGIPVGYPVEAGTRVASLDADGRVPLGELPDTVLNTNVEVNASVAGAMRVTAASGSESVAIENTRVINECLREVAARGGGRVRLPGGEGDYLVANTIDMPSNTELVGDGALFTRIRLRDGADLETSPSSQLVKTTGQSNIRIADIGFDGGEQDEQTLSVTLDGADNVWIERCSFRNMKRVISVFNATGGADTVPHHIYIRDNRFLDGVEDFAVRVVDDSEAADPHDIWIEGNTVEGVRNVIAQGETSAIRVAGTRVHVSDNLVMSTDDTGIMFAGSSRDCTATGNNITSKFVSIFCGSGSQRMRIANNSCTSSDDHGLHVYNPDNRDGDAFTTISGNVFYNCGKSGIHVEGAFGVSITGNQIVNPGTTLRGEENRESAGILVGNSYPAATNVSGMLTVTGNVITDNRDTKLMRYGIHAADATSAGGAASPGLVLWPNAISGAATASILLPSRAPDPAQSGVGAFWMTPGDSRPRWSDGTVWRYADGTVAG
jgi:hypothetical protein